MPHNKDFAHRLEILDACLRRPMRKWDAETLLEEINATLQERWGKKISRRTFFEDLKYLTEELGAPVEKYKEGSRVFYRYSEPGYSIKKLPLNAEDVGFLKDATRMLRQIGNIAMLNEVEAIVSKLEHAANTGDEHATAILFEQRSTADGTHHLDDLLQAIKGKLPLTLGYQPFSAVGVESCVVHPYLLKEYRGRWFLIGRKGAAATVATVFALDRIHSLKPSREHFVENNLFEPETHFRDVIGVSLPEGESAQEVCMRVYGRQCFYIRTKPIHHSQQVIEESVETMTIVLRVVNNYELRSTLMSYGPDVEVIAPEQLKLQMKALYTDGAQRYDL